MHHFFCYAQLKIGIFVTITYICCNYATPWFLISIIDHKYGFLMTNIILSAKLDI